MIAPITRVPGTTHITARSVSGFQNGAFSQCCPQGLAGGSLPSCKWFLASEEEFQPLTAFKSPRHPSRCRTVLRGGRKIPALLQPRTYRCDPTVPASSPAPPRQSCSPQGHQVLVQHPGGGLGDSAGNSPESSTSDPMAKPFPLLPESGSQPSAGREGKRQTVQTQTPALPVPASFMDLRADLQ